MLKRVIFVDYRLKVKYFLMLDNVVTFQLNEMT